MLDLLKNNLLLIKIAGIGVLLAFTSMVTWKIATAQMLQERLDNAKQVVEFQRKSFDDYIQKTATIKLEAKAAYIDNSALEAKIVNLTKEYRNARLSKESLPADCIIDDTGVRYLNSARDSAISSAGNADDSSMQKSK